MTTRGLLDRRGFVRLAALAAAGVACGRGRGVALPSPFGGLAGAIDPEAEPGLGVFLGAGELLAGERARLPIGLALADGSPVAEAEARAWVSPPGAGPRGPAPMRYRRWARPEAGEPPGFYVGEAVLGEAGVTDLLVEARASGGRILFGTTSFETRARAAVPLSGDRAVSVPTPTFRRTLGAADVCTRRPPCPMHREPLDRALRSGEPVVFIIGSPLLCSSRTCGPVLEEVLAVRREHRGRARFVHLEPYESHAATTLVRAARAWRLESEPWVFVIDGGGRLAARFEGPVGAREIDAALREVL